MSINIIKIFKPIYIFLFILLTGFLLRFYNINFDDLWIDEISTFWISDSELSLKESYLNHKKLEQTPFLFNLIIKVFYQIFGYKVEISRYLPFLFSFLSIVSVSYLSKLISKNNGFVFTSFLISYNIFLIGYAQELRVYSTLFFFISLSLIFFLKCINKYKFFNIFLFNIFTYISVLLHPFSILLLMSYLSVIIFFQKINYKSVNISLIIITILSLIFYYYFVKPSIDTPSWVLQIDLKFFTNFYFSKFFGSRLIGIIYLVIFIFLITKFYKKILQNKKVFLFFILLVYSYLFPVIYGFFFKPILIPRYIIFILIPIIILITYFIFELPNIKKNILISLICIVTLGNLLTEQTIKQFYKERIVYKPEFNKGLSVIKNSNNKNYSIMVDVTTGKAASDTWAESVKHYLNFLIFKNNLDIIYNEMDKISGEGAWVFCVHGLNNYKTWFSSEISPEGFYYVRDEIENPIALKINCKLPNNLVIQEVHKLNRLDIILTSVE